MPAHYSDGSEMSAMDAQKRIWVQIAINTGSAVGSVSAHSDLDVILAQIVANTGGGDLNQQNSRKRLLAQIAINVGGATYPNGDAVSPMDSISRLLVQIAFGTGGPLYENGNTVNAMDEDNYILVQIALNTEASGPTSLVFSTQPGSATIGEPFGQQPVVTVDDATFTGNVTIAINTGTGVLSGTLTKAAVAGVATFTDLEIDSVGNFTLVASIASPALSVNSASFAVAFSPAAVAGLALWVKGSSVPGVDGDRIATWTDLSGAGNHAVAAGAARPTLKTNIINGLAVARFDGVANVMESPLGNAAKTFTLFVVGWRRSVVADSSFFNQHEATGDCFGSGHWLITDNSGGSSTIGAYSDGFLSALPFPGSLAAPFKFSTRFTGTQNELWLNNDVDATPSAFSNDLIATASGIGAIFAASTYSVFDHLDIAEIIAYSTSISDVDHALVMDYLDTRYGL